MRSFLIGVCLVLICIIVVGTVAEKKGIETILSKPVDTARKPLLQNNEIGSGSHRVPVYFDYFSGTDKVNMNCNCAMNHLINIDLDLSDDFGRGNVIQSAWISGREITIDWTVEAYGDGTRPKEHHTIPEWAIKCADQFSHEYQQVMNPTVEDLLRNDTP